MANHLTGAKMQFKPNLIKYEGRLINKNQVTTKTKQQSQKKIRIETKLNLMKLKPYWSRGVC